MSRGKPVIRARGRGGPAKRNRDATEAEDAEQVTQQIPHPVSAASTPAATTTSPPSYHYDIRKAIRNVLDDKEFASICSAEGNIVLTTELLLDVVCSACDTAVHEPPQEAPITAERVVFHVLNATAEACSSSVVLSGFASLFARRAVNFLPKLEPLQPPQQQSSGADEGTSRPRHDARRGGAGGGRSGYHPSHTTHSAEDSANALLPLPTSSADLNGLLPTPSSTQYAPPQTSQWAGLPSPTTSLFPAPPQPASMFRAPPPAQPACSGRVIALDNVPHHFLGSDALRPQIQMISSRLRNCYFFNTMQISQTQTVIVSVNTPQAATELVARVNYTSHVDGGPILAREATSEETAALWAPLLQQLRTQEATTLENLELYDAKSPGKLRSSWHQAQEAMLRVDQELESSSLDGSLVPARKLELLRTKLAAKQQQDYATAELAALNESLEGPEHDACSSSTAAACGGASLIYILDVPPNIPDKKFLVFFEPLRSMAQLVHVWRDPSCPTQLCCALNSAGQVFGILRALDCNEFRFCGATFSKQRPQSSAPQQHQPLQQQQEQEQQQQQAVDEVTGADQ
ncbi:Hypothetical protein, putative [Bodo saltans]|uniref:Uncharacterized protein n=1 Tax=Bodo saltans TaxID=75058 RepID=A0A0S4J7K1_BODSA|nr:Hypothetical protein, putative [Bodo saltans]|eukprot:CUG87448.1 Hypothetical protein, putative [Bodo saltans]